MQIGIVEFDKVKKYILITSVMFFLFLLAGCMRLTYKAVDQLEGKLKIKIEKRSTVYLEFFEPTGNKNDTFVSFKNSLADHLATNGYTILSCKDGADINMKIRTDYYMKKVGHVEYLFFHKLGWPFTYCEGKVGGMKVYVQYITPWAKTNKTYIAYRIEPYGIIKPDGQTDWHKGDHYEKIVQAILSEIVEASKE